MEMHTQSAQDAARTPKAETQERIVGAAVAFFLERGFERTSISLVATRAGVSRASVFWHFGNKENLFREALRRVLVPFYAEFQANLEQLDPHKRLFEIVEAYERVVEEQGRAIRSMVRWTLESEKLRASLMPTLMELHAEFVRDVRRSLDELLRDSDEACAIAHAIASLLDGNLLLSMLDPATNDERLRRAGLRIVLERILDRDGR